MDIKLKKGKASGSLISAISSKSYVHRLLIASALCPDEVTIETNIMSSDMEATLGACEALSAESDEVTIDCKESGSTARFILPLSTLFCKKATLTGSGRLPLRPMGPLCDVLRSAGVSVSADTLPLTVSGPMRSGTYEIAGNVSSQFVSGLLFALPLLEGDSTLRIKGKLESAGYVDMTIDVLERFGIRIDTVSEGFFIPGSQTYRYKNSGTIRAEGDWSNAAYILALAVLGCGRAFDSFSIDSLDPKSRQKDMAVIDILKQFGVKISHKGGAYTVSGGPKRPVSVDCSQIPDLVPALAVIAAYVKGDSRFYNVERLRIKECDRIDGIEKMLGAVSVLVDITSDAKTGAEHMTVHGKGMSRPCEHPITIDSLNDHRIAMAAAATTFAEDEPVVIKDAMAVNKSYPGFFEVAGTMGLGSCHLH